MRSKRMKGNAEQFNNVAVEYDYVSTLQEGIDNCLSEHLPERKIRALDIGCGGGNHCIFLSEYFQSVVGIDISDEFLKIANRKIDEQQISNIEFLKCNAETMEVTGTFDFIYSRTTFHHLNVPKVLENCKRMLALDGVLYIIDNVSERVTPPTWTYIAGAILQFPGDCRRFGAKNAKRIFCHNISAEWLAHLASDKYLSDDDYHRVYGSVLPDCKFIRNDWNMKVIWEKVDSASR